MKTRALFSFILVAFLSVLVLSQTKPSKPSQTATLSYSLPSTLDWKQDTSDSMTREMQLYTLEDSESIRLLAVQVGNTNMWEKFVNSNADEIYKEFVAGKKYVHALAGYKNWTGKKSMRKKSNNEIIFEIYGDYTEGKEKKYYSEKYYLTPYGFIFASLDWSEESDLKLAKKAENEFQNIDFRVEIR